jgi:hypothetical protein
MNIQFPKVDQRFELQADWVAQSYNVGEVSLPKGAQLSLQSYSTHGNRAGVVFRVPGQKGGVRAIQRVEMSFDHFATADLVPVESGREKKPSIRERLLRGESVMVNAQQLSPGTTGLKGKVFLFPRGKMSLEEVLRKPYVVANAYRGISVGAAVEPSHPQYNRFQLRTLGGTNHYVRSEEDIIGWGTTSALEYIVQEPS